MHTEPRHKEHIPLGVLYTLLAALSFSLMSLLGKLIGQSASTDTVLFARYIVSVIFLAPWIIRNPKETLRIHEPGKLFARSAFTLLSVACFFYSFRFLSLGDALVLNNTFPLFIPLLAWVVHRIRTPHKMWIGISLGFIGVIFILRPGSGFIHPAALFGLASGIFAAISYIIVRFMTKSIPIVQILFYNFLICGLITGALLPIGWIHFSGKTWLFLSGVGVFGVVYQAFSTLGFAKAPVRLTSPLMYLTIVFGVIADFFIWGIVPDFWSLLGIACVIAGGILTIYFGQKEFRPKSL